MIKVTNLYIDKVEMYSETQKPDLYNYKSRVKLDIVFIVLVPPCPECGRELLVTCQIIIKHKSTSVSSN